ncbi:MAG: EAL domain-containing protein, partial [Mycoplasmataceae bacterium]|nr:EAL domain-containing protein [Mycoplasmataceae bacterium]
AHYDELTQLPNRTLFADRFQQAVAHSKRHENMLMVCFLDLDNFKFINDNFGHDMGDQILIDIATRLKDVIREEDSASRQGGDEFTLLLRDIYSFSQCEQLLERIHRELNNPHFIDGQVYNVGASIGATLFPIDNNDLDTLLRHADQAMYQAKLKGKNQYTLFNALDSNELVHKQAQLKEIEFALVNNEFCLYYQPKVNMKTGNVFGAEALIRWIHPEKGLIPPLDFLPLLDGTDLEIQVGEWVMNEAVKQLSKWQNQGVNLEISINISSHHLQSPLFFKQLTEILDKNPEVNSQDIQLEVLESSAIGDIRVMSGIISNCQRTLGVSVALDDFGTGYSSLTHMKHLSASTIKIDQSFVRDVLVDPDDYSIIESVLGLARAFNRGVIAEGVETEAHGLILLIMGCEDAQGFGISRPLPAENFSFWLESYIPNQYWIGYANAEHSEKEARIKLLKLTTMSWFLDVKNRALLAGEGSDLDPEINRCHLGIWLSHFRGEDIFDLGWLESLQQKHDDLYLLASSLIDAHQKSQPNIEKEGLDKFEIAYNEIMNIFDSPTLK